MKKLFLLLVLFASIMAVNAQKLTVPTDLIKIDSALYELTANGLIDGTFSNPVRQNGSTSYSVNQTQWNPTKSDLYYILANGGSISEVSLVLKVPASAMNSNATGNIPDLLTLGTTELIPIKWGQWFNSNAYWPDYDNGVVYVLTENHTNKILTGEQIKVILDLSGLVELMGQTDEEFQAIKGN